ncbi:hypothetical protein M422DRAFT_784475 [Sphaerobolus stellatus SS14]|uniref:Uncharacterized protein n=1 Tax=Sphaerobolus stellatus (strain SS14) TaxID=990650 RepID=A0A0C9UUE0_SPHS4|nr:hypothetical protein M422DRAFT_784475 [Sphaerobolus stellatus SS14]
MSIDWSMYKYEAILQPYPELSNGTQYGCGIKVQDKSVAKGRNIENAPQCCGCGNAFKSMVGPMCGRCTSTGVILEDTFEGELDNNIGNDKPPKKEVLNTAIDIMQQAEHHCSNASTLCLQKQPKNTGLQKADSYKTLKQISYKASKKISMNPVEFSAALTVKLEDAIRKMLLVTEHAYHECPASRDFQTLPSFKLEDVEIATKESRNFSSQLVCVKELIASNNMDKSLEDSDEGLEENSSNAKCRKKQINADKKKPCLFTNDSELESKDQISEGHKLELDSAIVLRLTCSAAHQQNLDKAKTPEPVTINEKYYVKELEPFITPYHCEADFDESRYDLHAF